MQMTTPMILRILLGLAALIVANGRAYANPYLPRSGEAAIKARFGTCAVTGGFMHLYAALDHRLFEKYGIEPEHVVVRGEKAAGCWFFPPSRLGQMFVTFLPCAVIFSGTSFGRPVARSTPVDQFTSTYGSASGFLSSAWKTTPAEASAPPTSVAASALKLSAIAMRCGSAVVGTHTHVPTADARVLPGGTAYITDVGMTGPRGGVIGVRKEQAIESLRTHMSVRFDTSDDDPWLMGVIVRCAPQPRRAESIEQLLMPWTAGSAGA